MKIIYKKKIKLSILSIIIFVVLLELVLRLFGWIDINSKLINEKGVIIKKPGIFTILCLGDSFTYGIGASPGKPYPENLKEILKNKFGDKFTVYNRGIPGQNTSDILEKLEEQLDEIKPDLVILMIGANNFWNFKGLVEIRKKSFFDYILNFLFYSKVFKLIFFTTTLLEKYFEEKLAAISLEGEILKLEKEIKTSSGNPDLYIKLGYIKESQKKYEEALELFRKVLVFDPLNYDAILGLGFQYLNKGLFKEAGEKFDFAILQNPEKVQAYLGKFDLLEDKNRLEEGIPLLKNYTVKYGISAEILIRLGKLYYSKNLNKEAIKCFMDAIKADPQKEEAYSRITAFFTARNYQDEKSFSEIFDLFRSYKNISLPAFKYFQILQKYSEKNKKNEFVLEWINSDLQKIIYLLKGRSVKVILQNYPNFDFLAKKINSIAISNSIPLVDNQKYFNNLLLSGYSYKELFIGDGHFNQKGYKLQADNVFTKVSELLLFNENSQQR